MRNKLLKLLKKYFTILICGSSWDMDKVYEELAIDIEKITEYKG